MTDRDVQADFDALAAQLSCYQPRPGQLDMARAVAGTLDAQGMLAVEAGTGVGKTFGYLLPVLRHPGRSLICTGTRHLQDQLYGKDLPLAQKALGQARSVCLLKGRANYLCRYRYEAHLADDLGLDSTGRGDLARLRNWAEHTVSGDLAELRLPEDHSLIPAITSTADNCLGQKCPKYRGCHVVQAREQAQQADLVITNHHLLASDLVLREEKLGPLLPSFDAHVIDEAHRLAEVLETAFGQRWTLEMTLQLATDLERHAAHAEPGPSALGRAADRVKAACLGLQAKLREYSGSRLGEQMDPPAEFADWARPLADALAQAEDILEEGRDEEPERETFQARVRRQREELSSWPGDDPDWVAYMVVTREHTRLHRVPIDISRQFTESRSHYGPCWVFTSATLGPASPDGGTEFDYLRLQLGLGEDLHTMSLPSPYDYPRQARLYLPRSLPPPDEKHYTQAVLEEVLPLIEALGGRTLMLFTSLRAMRRARDRLSGRTDLTVLMQGEESKTRLLRRLGEEEHTVLLGSISFWEGVDVPGSALRCVVIDRIPFASHRELVMQARMEAIRSKGGNPFLRLQLPRAALLLKQGAGRLIRSETDCGVVVLADPRLRTKRYGRLLLSGLPPMPEREDRDGILEFLRA